MFTSDVDELLSKLTSNITGLHCIGYADDIVIVANDKYEHTLCELVQAGIKVTERCCTAMGLTMNPAKNTAVPFTRRRKLASLKTIQISGEFVEFKQEVTFLGITNFFGTGTFRKLSVKS